MAPENVMPVTMSSDTGHCVISSFKLLDFPFPDQNSKVRRGEPAFAEDLLSTLWQS